MGEMQGELSDPRCEVKVSGSVCLCIFRFDSYLSAVACVIQYYKLIVAVNPWGFMVFL